MKKVNIITECPVCNSKLERVNAQLFCRNPSCEAKSSKKIAAFVKVVGIKGLGEKTIEKLNINSIEDIFTISSQFIIDTIGEALGNKLIMEIEKAKTISFSTYINSFSIPLIGKTASKKLEEVGISSVEEITFEKCKEAGLGDKATSNLLDWIENDYPEVSQLPIEIKASKVIKKPETGIKVCITGKLEAYTRTEAAKLLETYGIKVVSSVSKTLDYLVNEDNKPSSKLSKANDYGIPVVTINQLIEVINKNDTKME